VEDARRTAPSDAARGTEVGGAAGGTEVGAAPRRNVELKAIDPDPEGTRTRALAAGAEDRGVLNQRDTYFAVPRGRLKLREEEPGGGTLIAYERPDAAAERVSDYRLVPVPDPAAVRAALAAACGVRAEVVKRRHLLLWETVRIHLDDVDRLGRFVELEAVAAPGSDLERERDRVAHLRAALGIPDDALLEGSYADAVAAGRPDPELLAMARAAAGNAYAPYSSFPVGAAVRTADGRRYAGANVENAAYPQGQCAEASALGAMVAGGGGTVVEVVVAAPSRELCTPCGGCRQRLREFAGPGTPIHLADLERVRATTSVGELLPLSFGPEHLAG
jgi:homotetrameric cytidine deaminase